MIPTEELSEAVARSLGWVETPFKNEDGSSVIRWCHDDHGGARMKPPDSLAIENAITLMEREEWLGKLQYVMGDGVKDDYIGWAVVHSVANKDDVVLCHGCATHAEALCRAWLKLKEAEE